MSDGSDGLVVIGDELLALYQRVDTTAICDVDKSLRVMSPALRLRSARARLLGPAFTVRCRADFLGVLRAVESASRGDVIVVDGGGQELALAGELFARGAMRRDLAGIIVDAGYRDIGYVATCPLPIFSRFVTPMTGTSVKLGDLQVPITCGGVTVNPGDLIMADDEGIVVVAPDEAPALLQGAVAVKEAEGKLVHQLGEGGTLSEGLNLAEHVEALRRGEPSSLRVVL